MLILKLVNSWKRQAHECNDAVLAQTLNACAQQLYELVNANAVDASTTKVSPKEAGKRLVS